MNHCQQCQALMPPDADLCPYCGYRQVLPAPDALVAEKKPLKWDRKPYADAAVTQFVEIPVGGFPAPLQSPTPEAAPTPVRPDRSPLLLAICLGVLAGLFVILVIFGISRLRPTPTASSGLSSPHAVNQ